MAMTQTFGSDVAAMGLHAAQPDRAQAGLLDYLSVADAARGPPRDLAHL
jgi:hypothetical protein